MTSGFCAGFCPKNANAIGGRRIYPFYPIVCALPFVVFASHNPPGMYKPTGEECAVKIIRRSAAMQPMFLRHEVGILRSLDHPQIVRQAIKKSPSGLPIDSFASPRLACFLACGDVLTLHRFFRFSLHDNYLNSFVRPSTFLWRSIDLGADWPSVPCYIYIHLVRKTTI